MALASYKEDWEISFFQATMCLAKNHGLYYSGRRETQILGDSHQPPMVIMTTCQI